MLREIGHLCYDDGATQQNVLASCFFNPCEQHCLQVRVLTGTRTFSIIGESFSFIGVLGRLVPDVRQQHASRYFVLLGDFVLALLPCFHFL